MRSVTRPRWPVIATTAPASTAIRTITAAATASRLQRCRRLPVEAASDSSSGEAGTGRCLRTELRLKGHRLFERDLLGLRPLRIGRGRLKRGRSILSGKLCVPDCRGIQRRRSRRQRLTARSRARSRTPARRDRVEMPLAWEVTDRLSGEPVLSAAATLDRASDRDERDRCGNDGVDLAYAHIPPIRRRLPAPAPAALPWTGRPVMLVLKQFCVGLDVDQREDHVAELDHGASAEQCNSSRGHQKSARRLAQVPQRVRAEPRAC